MQKRISAGQQEQGYRNDIRYDEQAAGEMSNCRHG